MQRIAVFDMDNTLVNGSSLYYLLRDLWKQRFISVWDVIKFTKWQLQFQMSRTESPDSTQRITEIAMQLLAGKTPQEVSRLVDPAAQKIVEFHLISETLMELNAARNAGYEIWIASASPIEMAAAIGRYLKVDQVVATTPEIQNGFYTGALSRKSCHGPAKFEQVNELLTERGYSWTNVTAYSDSENDLPLLSAAAHAVVVNPNRRLEMLAKKNYWRVIKPKPVAVVGSEVMPKFELAPPLRLEIRPGSDLQLLH